MQTDPDNQSPDTITDEDEPVTIGEIAEAVAEKLKGLIPGVGATDGGTADAGSGSTPPPAASDAGSPPVTAPPPPPPSNGVVESVEATVRRVLSERDTDNRIAAVEEKVNKPAEPKPPRTGIAAIVFGKERA